MYPKRTARVAQELRQEIALIIQQEVKDPRLGFVTITNVELSPDATHARVFFSCLGGEDERERSLQALEHSAKFIRALIKKRFRLRVIPALAFRHDETIEQSIRLSETLDRLKSSPPPPSSVA